MAQSLWRDHDLDLRDEYDGEEWAEFAPGPLRPHWGAPRADGRPFPAHSPGLPLLLAPAYAAAGPRGLRAADGAAGRGRGARLSAAGAPAHGRREAALLAWLAAVGPPLFFYSFHLYTEAPSALAAGGSLLLLLGSAGRPRGGARGARRVRAAVAAPQDDPGGGRARPRRARAAARAGARGLPARGGRGGGRRSPATTGRSSASRRRSRSTAACPRTRGCSPGARSPASSSTGRSACCRSRPSSCWRSPGCRAVAAPARGLAARARGPGRARAARVLAHVVGRPVPAGAVPGADAAVPGCRAGAPARARTARASRAGGLGCC